MLIRLCVSLLCVVAWVGTAPAAEITGEYVETRNCDVYTGPCFANAEIGLAGQRALLAWRIDQGKFAGVDLAGLKVVLAIEAKSTLAKGGGMHTEPGPIRSVVLVDEQATAEQRQALESFAKHAAGESVGKVVRVDAMPISLQTDQVTLETSLQAGKVAKLVTRGLADGDRCCTNEEVFYPPLAELESSVPAFTIDGGFTGRGLSGQWTNPSTRSAFVGTFSF